MQVHLILLAIVGSGVQCAFIKPRIFELARLIPDFDSSLKPLNSGTIGQIEGNGYRGETHAVETEDGFILEMHRIPGPPTQNKNESSQTSGPLFPVLLIHGYLQSSSDWVINSPANNSFAFMLSEMGYDVWLGNTRGNSYSKRHTKYPINSNDYWDFSFHEMGIHDMTSMVDYILAETGKEKVHYIGFSHGAAVLITGLSTRPEYNEKIASGTVLAPSVFQDNYVHGVFNLSPLPAILLNGIINNFGAVPLIPPIFARVINSFLPIFCSPRLDILGICVNFIKLVFGDDGNLITKDQLPLITSFAPSSVGLKALAHTLQIAVSHRFSQYDYGFDRNLEIYGEHSPPLYNLSRVTVPVAVFVGIKDLLASKEDASTLAQKLPNLLSYNEVEYEKLNHIDFTYGKSIAAGVYMDVIQNIKIVEERIRRENQ